MSIGNKHSNILPSSQQFSAIVEKHDKKKAESMKTLSHQSIME